MLSSYSAFSFCFLFFLAMGYYQTSVCISLEFIVYQGNTFITKGRKEGRRERMKEGRRRAIAKQKGYERRGEENIAAAAAAPQKKAEKIPAEILRRSKKKITPPHFRDGMIACMTPNNP